MVNQTYCGDHFEIYKNIESLCCVTGTKIVLQVHYTSKTNKLTEERPDLWLPEGGGKGNWMNTVKRYKPPFIIQITLGIQFTT